jgi:elongation factor G
MELVDLLTRKAYHYDGEEHENAVEIPIPDDLKDIVEQKRAELVEKAVEFDDALMEKYLDGKELTIDEIKSAIRKGVLKAEFFPVTCGQCIIKYGC